MLVFVRFSSFSELISGYYNNQSKQSRLFYAIAAFSNVEYTFTFSQSKSYFKCIQLVDVAVLKTFYLSEEYFVSQ